MIPAVRIAAPTQNTFFCKSRLEVNSLFGQQLKHWFLVTSVTTCDKCDHMWQVWPPLHLPIWHALVTNALPSSPLTLMHTQGLPDLPIVGPQFSRKFWVLQAGQAERSFKLARPWSGGQPWRIRTFTESENNACQLARWHYLLVDIDMPCFRPICCRRKT